MVAIRRARSDDLDFLVELVAHEEVEPFLAAGRPHDREALADDIERNASEPEAHGLFVIEVDGELAGTMRFSSRGGRNRIADLGGLAVHPDFRGRRVADEAARLFQRHLFDELGFHRLQLEVYGFNERAMSMRSASASCSRAGSAARTSGRRMGRRRDLRAHGRRPRVTTTHASPSESGGSARKEEAGCDAPALALASGTPPGLSADAASIRQPTSPRT